MLEINLPSDVPPVVEISGVIFVTSLIAEEIASTSNPFSVMYG